MSHHFTATLAITSTETSAPAPHAQDRRHNSLPAKSDRDVVELARVVVRADDLDELKKKLAGHVELV